MSEALESVIMMVTASVIRLVITCLVVIMWISMVEANPDAKRLYDDLLSNYNRLIRPVANNTDKITVRMGLKLSQLVDLVSLGNLERAICIPGIFIGFGTTHYEKSLILEAVSVKCLCTK